MTTYEPSDFIKAVIEWSINSNISMYRKILNGNDDKKIRDEYWQRVSSLYNTLPSEDKELVFLMYHHAIVDAISCILEIIDNSTIVDKATSALTLQLGGKVISGYLREEFNSEVESITT